MDKWSMLGDNGSKSAGNPDIDIGPARAALAPFALSSNNKHRNKWRRVLRLLGTLLESLRCVEQINTCSLQQEQHWTFVKSGAVSPATAVRESDCKRRPGWRVTGRHENRGKTPYSRVHQVAQENSLVGIYRISSSGRMPFRSCCCTWGFGPSGSGVGNQRQSAAYTAEHG